MKQGIGAVLVAILLLPPFANPDEKKPLTFRLTLMGDIEDTTATEAGFHTSYSRTTHLGLKTFEASDGEKLTIRDGQFATPGEAATYFEWNMRNRVSQVITQSDKTNRDRKTVGRRAEYLLESGDKTKTWVVMWTDGATFVAIYAPTLKCALEAEKAQ